MSEAARETMAKIIVEEYGALIENVAHTLVKDGHLAEDVRQDVLMKLFTMENDILDRPAPVIKRYLYIMAKNRALNLIKEQSHQEGLIVRMQETYDESVAAADSLAFVDERGFSLEMQTLLNELTQVDRDIICLRYSDGFSYKEIAKIIDKTEAVVYQRVKRARDKLRQMLMEGGFASG